MRTSMRLCGIIWGSIRCPLDRDGAFAILKARLVFDCQVAPVQMTDHRFRMRTFDISKHKLEGVVVQDLVGARGSECGESHVMMDGAAQQVRPRPVCGTGDPATPAETEVVRGGVTFDGQPNLVAGRYK